MALTKTKKSVIDISSIIGGDSSQLQFNNNNSSFDGDLNLTWDNINKILNVSNINLNGRLLSPIQHRKNVIINGNFYVTQRGTIFSSVVNGTYTLDRWLFNTDTDDTVNISQQEFALGQLQVPDNPKYFMRTSIIAGTTGTYNQIHQPIESVFTLAGKTVTLSFYAKSSLTVNASASLQQVFGTTKSNEIEENFTITTNWTKIVKTFNIPSITGQIIDGIDYLLLRLKLPINTTVDIDIANVQLEEGNTDTNFEEKTLGEELELCQRYTVIRDWRCKFQVDWQIGYGYSQFFTFPVNMRSTPSMSRTYTNVSGSPNVTIGTVTNNGFMMIFDQTSGGAIEHQAYGVYTADAEIYS